MVSSVLWGTYLLALSTGIFLLFKQAAYDPPLSGKDWDTLEGLPYGVPYYYALYGKIIIFLLMGLATPVAVEQGEARVEGVRGGRRPGRPDL